MNPYNTVDDLFKDRRSGMLLSSVFDNLLQSPKLLSEFENPFDLIFDLYRGDYLDCASPCWINLAVYHQIRFASFYQDWYAKRSKNPVKIEMPSGMSPIPFQLILIPPMRFLSKSHLIDGGSIQDVSIIRLPFRMGKYQVTQDQWYGVMGYNRSNYQHIDQSHPVEMVSWTESVDFCNRVGLRLPHEKQWTLACRAGTTTDYSFGNDLEKLKHYAWTENNSGGHPQPVGMLRPNAFGLYDMHGNVFEWCSNKEPDSECRVIRGGSAMYPYFWSRSNTRFWDSAESRQPSRGLRLCTKFKV